MRYRQKVTSRQVTSRAGEHFLERAAVMLFVGVIVTVVGSIFCGVQLKRGQNALLIEQARGRLLVTVQQNLVVQRDKMASKERIGHVASKTLGMFPPGKDQVVAL